jgi:hypothetical protein
MEVVVMEVVAVAGLTTSAAAEVPVRTHLLALPNPSPKHRLNQ